MRNKWWAKTLRIIGIVFMSLTAVFTLMGGAGTSCAAFFPNNPSWADSMGPLVQMQWLYILYVIVTLAIGVMGVRAVVLLIKGTRNAYRYSLIALVAGLVVGAIHIYTSRLLRGSSMPVDMVVYTTALTLIIFLLFRIPGVWQGVNFEKPAPDKKTGRRAASIAMELSGALALTIQFLMAPTHTFGGVNYADVWHASLTGIGVILILAGGALLASPSLRLTAATEPVRA